MVELGQYPDTYDDGGAAAFRAFVVYLLIALVCGLFASNAWRNKGGSPAAGFWIGFLLGPVGLIVAYVAKPAGAPDISAPPGWMPRVGDLVVTRGFTQIKDSQSGIPAGQEMKVVGVDETAKLVSAQLPSGETHRFFLNTVAPKATTFAPPSGDYEDEIRRLARLRDEGHLTDEEFEAKKKQVLGL
jgi:hypothetical protein